MFQIFQVEMFTSGKSEYQKESYYFFPKCKISFLFIGHIDVYTCTVTANIDNKNKMIIIIIATRCLVNKFK